MTDEEIEDMNFKTYLETRYYEDLFTEFDQAIFTGLADFFEGDDDTD